MNSNQSLRITFREAVRPITIPETKFGGSPVWIESPQWPLSLATGQPMMFVGQVALERRIFPKTVAQMAYVFMNEQGDYATFDPDGGENAVILQPGVTTTPHVPLYSGPSVRTRSKDTVTGSLVLRSLEYATELSPQTDAAYIPQEQRDSWSLETEQQYWNTLEGNKIGGTPIFIQEDEFPFEDWRLLLQLFSDRRTPFWVNFGGGGIGYAFLNADGTQAKFLWQCS